MTNENSGTQLVKILQLPTTEDSASPVRGNSTKLCWPVNSCIIFNLLIILLLELLGYETTLNN